MIIEQTTDLGEISLQMPKKYCAFLGISLRNKYFTLKILESYFIWMAEHFEKSVIWLIDEPDKYNYIVFKNDTEVEAIRKSRAMSLEKKGSYEKLLNKLKIKNISVVLLSNFSNHKSYINILNKITSSHETDENFERDLYQIIENGIEGKFNEFVHINNISHDTAISLKRILFKYVVEELAGIIYLTENGYPIEIDPYEEFGAKKKLYENIFPSISNGLELSNRGHIYAYPEGNKYVKKRIGINQEVTSKEVLLNQ